MNSPFSTRSLIAAALLGGSAFTASADAITDWNVRSGELIAASKLGTPPAIRVMAIVQTAAYEAVNDAAAHASVDAAVAAAHRAAFTGLLPSQQAEIDSAYRAALSGIADGPAKTAGIAVGEKAAATVLAARAGEGAAASDTYRPHTTAGIYVPTATPAVSHWPHRKPWLMASAAQFRPGPPPALTSAQWARDYNEVKALGSKSSTQRSMEQTEIARFWEYSLPSIYHGVVRSVAQLPDRDVARNARLFAAVAQAMDDAMISVFDAKYQYHFWRPVTAIRNGDDDGHDGTEREAGWAPFINTPLHPEYPSAHAILAGAVGAVLRAETSGGPAPVLATTSPTAKGAARQWKSVDAFIQEVSDARVYEGVHYRSSSTVGAAMGERIGELAATRYLRGNERLAQKPAIDISAR